MKSIFRKTIWTEHSKLKMKQYGLSKMKLLGILHKPERKELGIVPGTVAVMQTKKVYSNPRSKLSKFQKKAPGEIWLMYKDSKEFRKIISAWRYPGISKPGEELPIPNDILKELLKNNDFK